MRRCNAVLGVDDGATRASSVQATLVGDRLVTVSRCTISGPILWLDQRDLLHRLGVELASSILRLARHRTHLLAAHARLDRRGRLTHLPTSCFRDTIWFQRSLHSLNVNSSLRSRRLSSSVIAQRRALARKRPGCDWQRHSEERTCRRPDSNCRLQRQMPRCATVRPSAARQLANLDVAASRSRVMPGPSFVLCVARRLARPSLLARGGCGPLTGCRAQGR